ncbi:GLPGLI family protein [Elizabethkingia miricola]|nr:GLPGLI family protein [Elizabethkingia miricola]MCL1654208.1 GLPGLI family protein [Elizabethkingia miricola]SPW34311.1 GLPGLI family protein [Elizabethkingia miricola]
MQKIFIFLIYIIFTYNLSAQSLRFIYDYKSMPNSLKKDSIVDEMMVLEIDPIQKESLFSSYTKIKSDSSMANGIQNFPDSSLRTRYIINKKLKNKEIVFYTPNYAGEPVLKIKDERPFIWHITNEKGKILSYPVQKATTDFGGRKWTAWFSTSLPFSDGPYKFSGLPGLILKITDSSNSHNYELVSIEKIKSDSYKMLTDVSYANSKQFSLSDYKKMVVENRKDPMKKIRTEIFQGKILFGSEQKRNEYIKTSERNLKIWKENNNNPIELDEL